LIKEDLMAMFRDFHRGFSLNFGVLSLIPKLQETKKIQGAYAC